MKWTELGDMQSEPARRRFWVIKGKDALTDWEGVLEPGSESRWFTKRPPKGWWMGDGVFFWRASPHVCIVGSGTLTGTGRRFGDETIFKVTAKTSRFDDPITAAALKKHRELASASFLKAGPAGTVFPLTEEQAVKIGSLIGESTVDTESQLIERALVVKAPWLEQILTGRKTWEMRSRPTNIRGRIGLIEKGSGTIIGTANLVDSIGPLSITEAKANATRMGFTANRRDVAKGLYAWVLEDRHRLRAPVAYRHPGGAIIWVRLAPDVQAALANEH